MRYTGPVENRRLVLDDEYNLRTEFKNDNFCCDQLRFHINYKERIILYIDRHKEYAIRCSVDEDKSHNISGTVQIIIDSEGFDIHESEDSTLSTPGHQDNSNNITSTPIYEGEGGDILSTPGAESDISNDTGFGEASGVPDTNVLYSDSKTTIDDSAKKHILDGDGDFGGGGHRYGTGKPGKSEFPQNWDDNRIIESIIDVAKDPKSSVTQSWGGRVVNYL